MRSWARVSVLVPAMVALAASVPFSSDEFPSEMMTVSKRLVRAKKLRSGQSVSIARDKSTGLSPSLYALVAPQIVRGLNDRGFEVATLSKADLLLVFEVATEALNACALKGPDYAYVKFYFRNPHAKDLRARHEFYIKVSRDDLKTTCPPVREMKRVGIAECPTACRFQGYVHHANVSVYDASAFRESREMLLMWDSLALLTDVESIDPVADDSALDLALTLIRAALEHFPDNGESRIELLSAAEARDQPHKSAHP